MFFIIPIYIYIMGSFCPIYIQQITRVLATAFIHCSLFFWGVKVHITWEFKASSEGNELFVSSVIMVQ